MNQETKERYAARLEEVEVGILDPLLVYAELKDLAQFFAECAAQVEELALQEAEKYPEKTFSHQGITFTKNAGRTIYDFKNVSQWAALKSKLARVEELSKQASKISVLTGGGVVVDDNGEIVTPCETKQSKPSLQIKFQ